MLTGQETVEFLSQVLSRAARAQEHMDSIQAKLFENSHEVATFLLEGNDDYEVNKVIVAQRGELAMYRHLSIKSSTRIRETDVVLCYESEHNPRAIQAVVVNFHKGNIYSKLVTIGPSSLTTKLSRFP